MFPTQPKFSFLFLVVFTFDFTHSYIHTEREREKKKNVRDGARSDALCGRLWRILQELFDFLEADWLSNCYNCYKISLMSTIFEIFEQKVVKIFKSWWKSHIAYDFWFFSRILVWNCKKILQNFVENFSFKNENSKNISSNFLQLILNFPLRFQPK